MNCKEAIENLEYLISGECTDNQVAFTEEIEMAIDVLQKLEQQKFIELPCKVGDTAWYISIERYVPLTYKIKEAKVVNFRADCNGIFEFEIKVEESIFLLSSEYVYFDKQKAEEKLRELNNG